MTQVFIACPLFISIFEQTEPLPMNRTKPFYPPFYLLILMLLAMVATFMPSGGQAAPAETKQWLNAWQETTPMRDVRSSAAYYAANGVIYMIGGIGGEVVRGKVGEDVAKSTTRMFMRSTEYARVQPDGSLSEWKAGPELNVKRGYFSAAGYGNHIYVVGGAHGPHGTSLLDSIERAEIKPDGTLGQWQLEDERLNIPRRCVKLAVVGNYLYAFGGFGGILLNTLERAEIKPDGSLGEWLVEENEFTVARYIHGVAQVDNGVYQIGGHNKESGGGIRKVEWSKQDKEGYFYPWTAATPLQKGRFGPAIAKHDGFIYAIGGLAGPVYLDSVERTHIDGEGRLSPWQYVAPLPAPREGAAAVVMGDTVYVLGGSNQNGFQNTVFYATFNQKGEIGYLATPEQIAEYEKIQLAKAKRPPLPHQGTVLEHIKRPQYSYLKVKMDDGVQVWLAAPAKDLKPGDRVGFSNGAIMRDFHSKSLNRTFPFIVFISEVRLIEP